MLLSVHNLSKSFGGVQAVNAIDWSIGEGEIRTIIGPNGAGKSTFFHMLCGRIRPDRGRIIFSGRDVIGDQPFQFACSGLVIKPQTLGVFSELTVAQNLRLARQRFSQGPLLGHEVSRRLEMVGLAEKHDIPAREIAHGEKQWLGLAMAVALDPKLLLLDEPTAGLSVSETRRVVEVIRSIASTGVAVAAVEHDMAFVRNLDAHITVLHNGSVFASGTLDEIEAHDEVRRLYLGSSRTVAASRASGGVAPANRRTTRPETTSLNPK